MSKMKNTLMDTMDKTSNAVSVLADIIHEEEKGVNVITDMSVGTYLVAEIVQLLVEAFPEAIGEEVDHASLSSNGEMHTLKVLPLALYVAPQKEKFRKRLQTEVFVALASGLPAVDVLMIPDRPKL